MTTLSLMTNFYSESDKSRNVSSKGENKHQPKRIAMGQKDLQGTQKFVLKSLKHCRYSTEQGFNFPFSSYPCRTTEIFYDI